MPHKFKPTPEMPYPPHPTWGKHPSAETRALLSAKKKGDLNPMKRPEVRAKFKATMAAKRAAKAAENGQS
jgi:hypothetical protein